MLVLAALAVAASQVERRIPAPEARQGVASDGAYVYAIDDHRIGKYAIASGRRVASWNGDPSRFHHINSCTVVGPELVCAASNYPARLQLSSVEFFDAKTLAHIRTASLGQGPGSLSALDRHRGQWWAVFANYDGRGGQPGRDHRATVLVRMDDAFRTIQSWALPRSILQRIRPNSISGASWAADGRLAMTGHDRRELYVVSIPAKGSVLTHVATVPIMTPGQAIDWDPRDPKLLWSIDRKRREIVATRPKL
jgi:hypothetical protein